MSHLIFGQLILMIFLEKFFQGFFFSEAQVNWKQK